uniref:A52R-like family protein n=1 Tax=Swinepox virus TaxID=10276 RepID=A0A0N9DU28_SWPV|nr:A52R-like family protein [Swinepox virus]
MDSCSLHRINKSDFTILVNPTDSLDVNDVDTLNDFSLTFCYDTIDYISIDDSIITILEEYFSWRSFIGRIELVPQTVGKIYVDLMNLDNLARKLFGNLEILANDIIQLGYDGADVRLFKFITDTGINFNNNKVLVLIGFFGYVCEYWGRQKNNRYIKNIMPWITSNISEDTLLKICNYI